MNLIKTLKRFDGPFSARGKIISYSEVHAFTIGLYDGIWINSSNRYDDRKGILDVRQEPHYYMSGYMIANRGKYIGTAVGITGAFMNPVCHNILSILI